MRFLFINQYGPPDSPPTARLLGELANRLQAHGHEVEILCQSLSYQERPSRGGRLKRELQAAWTILHAGWKYRSNKPDMVLALSSPPGLLVVGALLAWRHRARLAHWAMDLYPELALALGEINHGSIVARIVQTAMHWAYRRATLVVALDADMQTHLQAFCPASVRVMEPWPARTVEKQIGEIITSGAATERSPTEPWMWLYSGNLGRAHEWQTLLDAQALLEARGLPIHLVFQGDGAARIPAKACAEKLGLRGCLWKGYAAEENLLTTMLASQILIVTQRPETRGLLWPSKLALLERLPLPILFVGPENGAIALRLRERKNTGVFSPGQAQAVAQWIEDVFSGKIVWDAAQSPPLPTVAEQSDRLQRWLIECEDLPVVSGGRANV